MAKSNNSNLVLAVIITCLLSAGIVTGILFATKPWCDKNEKYSSSQNYGTSPDDMKGYCNGVNIIKQCSTDSKSACNNCCVRNCSQHCLKSKGGSLNSQTDCHTNCSDLCAENTGGGNKSGNDGKFDSCMNYSDSSYFNCRSLIGQCCEDLTNCGPNCQQDCKNYAERHCSNLNPGGDPSPPPGGGGGSPPSPPPGPSPSPSPGGGGRPLPSPPPSPSPSPSPGGGGGGNNVESSKPFYEQPAGIGLIVFLVLLVGGGGAFLYMKSKKGKGK